MILSASSLLTPDSCARNSASRCALDCCCACALTRSLYVSARAWGTGAVMANPRDAHIAVTESAAIAGLLIRVKDIRPSFR